MRWTNDYGDIPRWYWGPAFRRPRRRGDRASALATLLSIAALAL